MLFKMMVATQRQLRNDALYYVFLEAGLVVLDDGSPTYQHGLSVHIACIIGQQDQRNDS